MIFWTLQTTIISIIFIFLIHHLINFFKTTLTIPKVKDMVNAPISKYENMYKTMNSSSASLKTNQSDDMKNELKNFLKRQIKDSGSSSSTTDIYTLDSFGSSAMSSSSSYGLV